MTGGFFAILDDIALLLDDAAAMSKVAARKTAGILGDDLAVNAEKATGFAASRELPVLWEITKGSFVNKIVILPLAFLLSAYMPWTIVPVLLLGGMYLSFEGMEKIYHVIHEKFFHKSSPEEGNVEKLTEGELASQEKTKIKSAIRTDFILSIEIIMIALGTMMSQSLLLQVIVVSIVAIVATVGVYGLVAVIVRLDDVGFYLIKKAKKLRGKIALFLAWCGRGMVLSLPWIIRGLGIIGTIAMLLVGGGMFTHNIPQLHSALHAVPQLLADFMVGGVVGSVIVLFLEIVKKIRG